MLKKFFDLIGLIEDRFLKKFIVLVFFVSSICPNRNLRIRFNNSYFCFIVWGENEILIFSKNYFHFEDKNEIIIF